jgi:hypothetical protein
MGEDGLVVYAAGEKGAGQVGWLCVVGFVWLALRAGGWFLARLAACAEARRAMIAHAGTDLSIFS